MTSDTATLDEVPGAAVYPDGVLGDLMQQRDDQLAEADRLHGLATIYTGQAATAEAAASRLTAMISTLNPQEAPA